MKVSQYNALRESAIKIVDSFQSDPYFTKIISTQLAQHLMLYTQGEVAVNYHGTAHKYELKLKSMGAGTQKVWIELCK